MALLLVPVPIVSVLVPGGDVGATVQGEVLFVSSTEDGVVVRIDLSSLAAMTIASGLDSAEGIACGPDGRLYVTQSSVYGGPRRIVSMEADGSDLAVTLDFETEPLLQGSGGPEGPSFGPGGELFFNTNPSGGPSTGTWKLPEGDTPMLVIPPFSNYSEAIVFPKVGPFTGHLLLVDHEHERILRRPPPFESAEPAVDFIMEEISSPNGFAEDSEGNLYVASTGGSIQRFSANGVFLGPFAAMDLTPRKIGFDDSDHLYVATVEGPVVRIAPDGAAATVGNVFGGNGVAVCGLGPTPPPPCPRSQGFWKNHPKAWPVDSLEIGRGTLDRQSLLRLLGTPPRGDASVILVRQLIAAELNVAGGVESVPVEAVLQEAHAALAGYADPPPNGVSPATREGHRMVSIADVLDEFNNGRLTPGC